MLAPSGLSQKGEKKVGENKRVAYQAITTMVHKRGMILDFDRTEGN
jgi:hypothetical protein